MNLHGSSQAFPSLDMEGMSLREYYSGLMMAALVQHYGALNSTITNFEKKRDLAQIALAHADALIEALNKRPVRNPAPLLEDDRQDDWRQREGIPD